MNKLFEKLFGKPSEMTGTAKIGILNIPMEQFLAMNAKQLALLYLQQAQLAGVTLAEEITFDQDGNLHIADAEGCVTHTK